MNIVSKPLLVIGLLLVLASCTPKSGELTKEQMKEDVSYFFKCFTSTHPNPYCRATPKQVYSIKTALLQKIDKGLAKEEFLNELGKLNGLLDGHSYIESPLTDHTEKDTILLPTSVRVNTDLTLSLNDDRLPETNTITSINGTPSRKLIDQLNGMLHADPGVEKKPEIECRFPILLIRAGIRAPYTISIKTTSGDTVLHLKGAAQVAYSKTIRFLRVNSDVPELDSGIFQRSKMAILHFNTCMPKNEDEFKKKIDSFFATIQKQGIKYLFIDNSRNNGGNSSWGVYLLSKINHKEYQYTHWAQIRKSEASERVKRSRADNGLAGTFNRTFSTVTNGFSGKVYMLLSNNTFSSGSDAAWQFRFAKAGKILGEKSGSGNPMYVYPTEFTFPNCQLIFRLSVRKSGYITFRGKKMEFIKEPEPDVPFNINPFKTKYSEQELVELLKLADKR